MMASRTQYELEILLGARKAATFDSSIGNAKTGIDSISSTAKKAAAVITGAFAAVNITDAIQDAMETYSDFEQSLANTAAIAGASSTEYKKLEEAAREAGKSTSKTAQESSEALGYMALAGWDVQESTSALMPVLKLSEATQMDLAETSDLVTDSMSALKLEIKELPQYLDTVVQGNNAANMTSQQMMQSMILSGGAARTLNVDYTDLGTAIGILANNGTKGNKAGIAMNAMLTRIASNDAALKMMDSLNISIFDAKGSFVGLENALQEINEGVDGLSVEDKAKALKEIAGTQYYSKMTYLLESVKEGANGAESAWDELNSSLENSDGALENMDSKVMDTMQGAKKIMESAFDDVKISFADAFDEEAVEVMNRLGEGFNTLSENIQNFSEEHESEIHIIFEDVMDGAESIIDVVGDAADIFVENWELIESVVVGAGTAAALGKVANGVMGVGKAVSAVKAGSSVAEVMGLAGSLSAIATPLGAVTAGAVVAGTAFAGISTYVKKTHDNMVNASLEEHFGDINLSLEELDELAQSIVGKRKLTQISGMLESIADTQDSIDGMTDSFKEIEKVSWKLNAGIEITNDDKDAYVSSVKQYVEEAQNAVTSQGYTVSIATKLLVGNDSAIASENDEYFAGLDQQLSNLQKKLNKRINKVVENGLSINKDEKIQKLLGDISDITAAVTDAQDEAALQNIELKYSGKDMQVEDFEQLTKDLADYQNQVMDGADEAYQASMTTLNQRLASGDISKKKYKVEKSQLDEGYYQTQAESMANSWEYIMHTVKDVYPEVSEKTLDTIQKNIQSGIDTELKNALENGTSVNNLGHITDKIVDDALKNSGVSNGTREELEKLFNGGIGDFAQSMESSYNQMKDNGVEIPKEYRNQVHDMESLGALSGSVDEAYAMLGDKLSDSPQYTALMEAGYGTGEDISESIIAGIGETTPEVQAAVANLMNKINDGMGGTFTVSLDVAAGAFQKTKDSLFQSSSQSKNTSTTYKDKKGDHTIYRNAKGGIYSSPILTTFAEKGPEAAIPLDGSERGKSLLRQANEIMGMRVVEDTTNYPKVTRDKELYAKLAQSTGGNTVRQTNVSQGAAPVFHISYSPKIEISGNADQSVVEKALEISQEKFKAMMEEYQSSQARVSFAGH